MIDLPICVAGFCLLASCSGIAFWAGTLRVKGLSAEAYAEQRLPAINAKLDEAGKGFIFLAGDSHAEFMNSSYRLCGREIVNGGICGAKAGVYRELVPKLRFRSQPDAVVLTIGTNHLTRKRDPLAPAEQEAFFSDVSEIVASLRKVTPRVIVTSVPPIDAASEDFEIPAVAAYSEKLRALCAEAGCDFVDPYDAAREADRSTARPGAMRDGLHMASYRAVQVRLGELLCPGGDLRPSGAEKAPQALR
jgi:lysophospholipase L1-like esterase